MSNAARIAIVAVLVFAVGGVLALKWKDRPTAEAGPAAQSEADIPRLLDFGMGKCVACKMMKPILEELQANYADRFRVEFIDIGKNPPIGEAYEIAVMPTQIFQDASGKELFRHEGFMSKEDIFDRWKKLGFDFGEAPAETDEP